MSPELEELLRFHESTGLSDEALLWPLFLLAPGPTIEDDLAWLPPEWHQLFIALMKEHYDNDVAPEDYLHVGNVAEPGDLRDRIRKVKSWLKRERNVEQIRTMTVITAEQASQRGLPAIGFSVDMQGARMKAHLFRSPGQYLTGSGGPGSPQSFAVLGVKAPAAASLDLAAVVSAAFARNSALELGLPCSIRIGNESRPAIAFSTGAGITFTSWCGTTFHGSDGVMLVAFGYKGAPAKSPEVIFSDPYLRTLAESFRIEP